ncbi:MAG: hypothetical protein ACSHX0_11875 [Akkermansiaceae bacterium]
MSNISNLVLLAACFGGGFLVEPLIRPNVQTDAAANQPKETTDSQTAKTVELAEKEELAAPTIQMDLSKVTLEDFPDKVTLLKDIEIVDSISGVKMQLAKGTLVNPVKINAGMLVVSPIGIPIETEVPADDTNFKELTLPKMLARMQQTSESPAKTSPTKQLPSEEVTPEQVSPPAAVGTLEPAAPAEVLDPAPTTIPSPISSPEEPASALSSEPEDAIMGSVTSTKLTEQQIIDKMKDHITAGKVKEFTALQVTEITAGVPTLVKGVNYEETGRVIFTAQTILGEQTHGAIALFKGGEIEKWVWAKNLLEMR